MLRAVLDANVFVCALIRPQGPPGRIVKQLFEAQAFELISSSAIVSELRRCLFYRKVRKHIRSSDAELELWFASLELVATMAEGDGPRDTRLVDADDAIYLNAAFTGRASYIVSGDAHLIELERYEGIEIVRPVQFLRYLA